MQWRTWTSQSFDNRYHLGYRDGFFQECHVKLQQFSFDILFYVIDYENGEFTMQTVDPDVLVLRT